MIDNIRCIIVDNLLSLCLHILPKKEQTRLYFFVSEYWRENIINLETYKFYRSNPAMELLRDLSKTEQKSFIVTKELLRQAFQVKK